jgi:hypothetical protein
MREAAAPDPGRGAGDPVERGLGGEEEEEGGDELLGWNLQVLYWDGK